MQFNTFCLQKIIRFIVASTSIAYYINEIRSDTSVELFCVNNRNWLFDVLIINSFEAILHDQCILSAL